MGMNYYVMGKTTHSRANDLWDSYKDTYNNTQPLIDEIKSIIIKKFQPALDIVSKYDDLKYIAELFEDDVDTTTREFINDIKYGVLDCFDLDENHSIHIGKSSYGWLFNFQDQNTELEGVDLSWHTYDEVKNWLTEFVEKQKRFVIKDEEDRLVTVKELFNLIDEKQNDPKNLSNPDNFTYCRNVNGYRFSSGDFS